MNTSTFDSPWLGALHAAANGWPVFPLRPGSKRPALHGESRCPRTGACADGHAKWEDRATTDPEQIRRCWETGPFNAGIATGPAGLVVVDLDVPKNDKGMKDMPCGMTTFTALCERAGQPVPTTHTVRTPSGGSHLYFRSPEGARLGNTAGTLGALIDTRAWGGYVVASGSITPQGAYEIDDPAPVGPLPAWLASLLNPARTPQTPPTVHVPRNVPAYVAAALRNEAAAVAGAWEGTRNLTLVRAARALGRFVASGDLDRGTVQDALKEAGEAAGLSERDCTPAIANALDWSITHNPGPTA
ncbi:bifunctional DNA primase/polymerase [Streptomyces netropsis]|uniref:DNA primase/polymerase bifunctional N-terminal domain-containing protein n=1 Tax=Streptomyces netropsis TaxID=55404 RepID=A0A7W7PBV7_STRNE|nr:bifunctional DNA primase/polymerase [Streptomyces netropsis]MBB4885006.1 hypothetical protein [Streptomyces netropsis]GGR26038.1 hypothetical protein GCM10010219_33520 [Streptomyces netropsis]